MGAFYIKSPPLPFKLNKFEYHQAQPMLYVDGPLRRPLRSTAVREEIAIKAFEEETAPTSGLRIFKIEKLLGRQF